MSHRDRHHLGRVAVAAGALALASAVAGGWLLVTGSTSVPEAAPLPVPFTSVDAAAAPPPDGAGHRAPVAMAPDRLAIPSLGIEAPLLRAGIRDNELVIPENPAELTLFTGGADPCDPAGTVLLAGHVAVRGRPGALWPLSGIRPRADAWITCADGTPTRWRATSVEVTGKADLPQKVFTATGDRRLVIVTCGGPVVGHRYRDNVIVSFEPVPDAPR